MTHHWGKSEEELKARTEGRNWCKYHVEVVHISWVLMICSAYFIVAYSEVHPLESIGCQK